jgi:hypothetical protein
MGYKFTISGGVRVKADKEYPWPCASSPNRTIELFTDDVLTKSEDGTYMVHTGVGCFGIVLKDEEVEPIGKDVALRIL